ncbi:restriction endonuclease subunit S [Polaribacter sp. WD7]|uniref:restriction endonuclease subunit S n=1 Tax=Polaribacter sp. WD7 TaxID=2269061 RepID=UPI000DF21755|nr:restriction endonuclease subunit S [Polaribacter sp. WD7]RCS28096.1 restriction endonuclease subunit S [Polaribacter sp. WD7]
MISNYRKIGDFIRQVNVRNDDENIELLLGVNLDKVFIPSVANTNGTDMTKYKVIKKGQFGCKLMSVGRDKKLPISRLVDHEKALISSAYYVFEVSDESILNPEYLMMWFSRSESDRYLWFQSGGDVRGRITWDDLCDLPIKVPSIEKQNEIVKEYNTVVNRIKLNEQLNQKLEETAQALYKHWFVDFNFPNTEGKPYKSSGGAMVYNEELDKEIPVRWSVEPLKKHTSFSKDRVSINSLSIENYISTDNMLQNKKGITKANKLPSSKTVAKFISGDVLISNIRPYLKKIWHASFVGGASNDVLCLTIKNKDYQSFIYTILEQDSFFDYIMQGAKGTKMPRGDKDWVMNYHIINPSKYVLSKFTKFSKIFLNSKKVKHEQERYLLELSNILLKRMTIVEAEKEIIN